MCRNCSTDCLGAFPGFAFFDASPRVSARTSFSCFPCGDGDEVLGESDRIVGVFLVFDPGIAAPLSAAPLRHDVPADGTDGDMIVRSAALRGHDHFVSCSAERALVQMGVLVGHSGWLQ